MWPKSKESYISPRRRNRNEISTAVIHHDGRKGRVTLKGASSNPGQLCTVIWELRALWRQKTPKSPWRIVWYISPRRWNQNKQCKAVVHHDAGNARVALKRALSNPGRLCTAILELRAVVAAKITKIALANCMVYLPSLMEIEQTKDSGRPP
jgi:hypothetical protein